MSPPPPGAKGTMTRTALTGYVEVCDGVCAALQGTPGKHARRAAPHRVELT